MLAAQTIRATVRGRVQGVGFRLYVLRAATALSVTGYVRNAERPDTVEVVVCGEATPVQDLVAAIKAGPPGARVDTVTIERIEAVGSYTDFTVRY